VITSLRRRIGIFILAYEDAKQQEEQIDEEKIDVTIKK
jgi:hypothetical protein